MEYYIHAEKNLYWGIGSIFHKKIFVIHFGVIDTSGTTTVEPMDFNLNRYFFAKKKKQYIDERKCLGYKVMSKNEFQSKSPSKLYHEYVENILQRQEDGRHLFTVEVIRLGENTIVRSFGLR